ncbi:ABC transporter substrate-binding protein [Halogeometricum limi]|uniref:Multiple sugar transport system substrate-binding protein n=1 Tax=Halogeometricum limi TaxID=555875 RepID=A0A1I6IAV0_9EURY|nr:extracellular solute-binding protein [Halogeometricum limi]SFR63510.1 multiple sugar transport system substrate-binding protein [Halogeometricum limi]
MTYSDRLTRRNVLRAGTVGLAGGLAGCVGSFGGGGSGGSADAIQYWNIHNGDDFRGPINEIVASFEESSGTTVEARYIDNDAIAEQISSAVASNTLPTVGLLAIQTIQRLGADGSLAPESTTQVVEEIGKDDFREGPLKFMSSGDGGYYGVPADAWVQGIWYRKSAFEEEGLEPPVTWDAILEAAETFHDPDNDVYGIGFGTKVTAYARQCFTQFAQSNDARVLDADANVVFDSQEMIEALQFLADLGEFVPGAVSFEDTRNLYGNEQEHMFMYSSYLLPDLLADEGEEMVSDTGLAPATEKKRRSTYGQVLGHCIFGKSDAKQQTGRDFLNHVMSDDQYVKWVHTNPGGTMPVLKSTSESEAYLDNEILSAWSDTIEQISSALGNIDRFDFVDGTLLPEFGQISGNSLVAEAVNRVVIKGHAPDTVAKEQAEKMRNALS